MMNHKVSCEHYVLPTRLNNTQTFEFPMKCADQMAQCLKMKVVKG